MPNNHSLDRAESPDLTEISFEHAFLTFAIEKVDAGRGVQVFLSLEEVNVGLRSTGYIADSIATTTVYSASKLQKPLLLEGPAGSGKTQLAASFLLRRLRRRAHPVGNPSVVIAVDVRRQPCPPPSVDVPSFVHDDGASTSCADIDS
jgi:hypothetical protein